MNRLDFRESEVVTIDRRTAKRSLTYILDKIYYYNNVLLGSQGKRSDLSIYLGSDLFLRVSILRWHISATNSAIWHSENNPLSVMIVAGLKSHNNLIGHAYT